MHLKQKSKKKILKKMISQLQTDTHFTPWTPHYASIVPKKVYLPPPSQAQGAAISIQMHCIVTNNLHKGSALFSPLLAKLSSHWSGLRVCAREY